MTHKLVRWDRIVGYMKLVAAGSDRVHFRELGKTSNGNPFIALEISSPETLNSLDRYKQLERKRISRAARRLTASATRSSAKARSLSS